MTQEEKSKRYDEAVREASIAYKDEDKHLKATLERIFPELKESEDESIKREIIGFIRNAYWTSNRKRYNELVAWLEKQGKQKPFDYENANIQQKDFASTEPKFHEGEWVVSEVTGSAYQIKSCVENLSSHKYGYDLTSGGYIGSAEVNHYHIWTIKDAKNGDILVDEDNNLGIYRGKVDAVDWLSYIYLGCDNHLYGFNIGGYHNIKKTKPATKEQRDLLFQKMHEAGYKWDSDKKELNTLM